jgi:16S rRNA (cytidine1402-2'-O)-methyltransferase
MSKTGTLFLIPVALGDIAWERFIPAQTQAIATGLTHFVVENAKAARTELKRMVHPGPLRELSIEELPEGPKQGDLDKLLLPLANGTDVGLMSDAGCPGVADPGALLVRRAHELGYKVRPLIGPSSLLLGLMASGLDGQRFAFHGYLPARSPEREQKIISLEADSKRNNQTQLFIETPYRNTALFQALLNTCQASTRLCVASDLSLPSETIQTMTIKQWQKNEPPFLERRPTVFLFLA